MDHRTGEVRVCVWHNPGVSDVSESLGLGGVALRITKFVYSSHNSNPSPHSHATHSIQLNTKITEAWLMAFKHEALMPQIL